MSVAVLEAEVVPSLDTLAETINREHTLVCAAANDMVAHAILAGHALLTARSIVPPKDWTIWLAQNSPVGPKQARTYQRLATYEDIIRTQPSIAAARTALRGKPFVAPRGPRPGDWHHTARMLYKRGATRAEIAEIYGVHWTTVREVTMDASERAELRRNQAARKATERRRLRDEQNALARAEREGAVRAAGGGVSLAYSLIRKTAQALDALTEDGASPELRSFASAALMHLYRCEDELCKGLRL